MEERSTVSNYYDVRAAGTGVQHEAGPHIVSPVCAGMPPTGLVQTNWYIPRVMSVHPDVKHHSKYWYATARTTTSNVVRLYTQRSALHSLFKHSYIQVLGSDLAVPVKVQNCSGEEERRIEVSERMWVRDTREKEREREER